ncbi:hypothetical protein GCM10023354_01770 [Garicola koreensis]
MAAKHMVPLTGDDEQSPDGAQTVPRQTQGVKRRRRRAAKKPTKPLIRSAATGYVAAQSVSLVSKQAFHDDGTLTPAAETWLTRAVTVQRPVVLANLRRMRKAHPTLTNRQLAMQLDKEFKRSMTGGGALIGATAAVPGVGTATSLGISTLATGSFLEICALYAQSMAELSGISTADPHRAKLLVMGVMLGEEGRRLLGELSDQAAGRGKGPMASMVPLTGSAKLAGGTSSMAGLIGDQIKRQFLRRFFIRQGTSMVGRAIPFGIGAVVGGVGNRALAGQVIRTAAETFGELPEQTPPNLVEDFRRGLQREQLRADRKERRQLKNQVKSETKATRRAAKELRRSTGSDSSATPPDEGEPI